MSSPYPGSANLSFPVAEEKNSSSKKIVKLRKIPLIPIRPRADTEEDGDFDFGNDDSGDSKLIKGTTLGLNQIRPRSSSLPLALANSSGSGNTQSNSDSATKDMANLRSQLSSASKQAASTFVEHGKKVRWCQSKSLSPFTPDVNGFSCHLCQRNTISKVPVYYPPNQWSDSGH